MKVLIWLLVSLLIIFHQDFWNWDNDYCLFGFLPIGLAYHIGVSLSAAFVWFLACFIAWPAGVDDFETDSSQSEEGATE